MENTVQPDFSTEYDIIFHQHNTLEEVIFG